MTDESSGSDGFIIIVVLIAVVVLFSISVTEINTAFKSFFTWVFWISIILIFILGAILTIRYIKRKTKFRTSANLNFQSESNNSSNNQIAILEITSLPDWTDISEEESQAAIQESSNRQLLATENFIRNCMNALLPFGMMLFYTQGKGKLLYWTSAQENGSTNITLLKERIFQMKDFLETNFPEIKTRATFSSKSLFSSLIKNTKYKEEHQVKFVGENISGKNFITSEATRPFLNELNLFFRKKDENNRGRSGFFCITSHPERQDGPVHFLQKKLTNRKYQRISQGVQKGFTDERLFGSGKISTSRASIHHNEKLHLTSLDYEKVKAPIINNVGILVCCAGSAISEREAIEDAERSLTRAKSTLSQIVNPNIDNSYHFSPLSSQELDEQLNKLFFVDSYLMPNSSRCLSFSLALLMRMPNTNTGVKIARAEKSHLPTPNFSAPTDNSFIIGRSLRFSESTDSYPFGLDIHWSFKNLVKHTFVTGSTGSGKTYTICNIIINAAQMDVPAIILDFGKGELYSLLQQIIPNIRCFTIGDDSVCPIRINPLECPEWTTPQQHFDNLKWILDSSLPQFEPLPIVTYRALSKLYNTDGWNLATGEKGRNRTLKDLLDEGLRICDSAGYADEVYHNMRGAFEMRISYLMEGALGRQLYTENSIDMRLLTERTSVLEIRTIEGSAQKIITLTLLTQLFDYFKSLGPTNDEKPRCLIVLDEAESIFASAEAFGNDVEATTAAYTSVQKLNQILRQGRSYGLAVILATQSPTNISNEILANTENKIIHRLHHGKDKRVIQEALELTNTQTQKLSTLKPGEGYAIDGENDYPYFLKVEKPLFARVTFARRESNELMKEQMERFYQQYPWMKESYQEIEEEESFLDGVFDAFDDRDEFDDATQRRLDLVLKRGEFTRELIFLVRKYYMKENSESNFYKELLELLHSTATTIIGSRKENLRPAAMELLSLGLEKCSFLNNANRMKIHKATKDLVYIDGGS